MVVKNKYRSVDEIKKRMARYCAYRERSYHETLKKLREYRLKPEIEDEIIAFLTEENFLDDLRFAQIYARSKFYQKHWGRRKIVQGMKLHRLTDYFIKKGMEEIDAEDYKNTIRTLIRKKYETLYEDDKRTKKHKIVRFLQGKGYDYEEFKEILDEELKTLDT